MSLAIVTNGYLGAGGRSATPQGPATIIPGPSAQDIEEFIPEVASSAGSSLKPNAVDTSSDNSAPTSVGVATRDIRPRPMISTTLLPKPINSRGN